LKEAVENLKKKSCKVPEDPEPSCELDCKKAKDRLVIQNQIIENSKEKFGDCDNTDNKDDSCQDEKNELEMQKKLLVYIEANAKNCTCGTDEKEETETCEDL